MDPGVEVRSGMVPVSETEMKTDISGQPTLLETGSLSWFIIERGDRYRIRLRDYEHPALTEFQGIESYDPDPDWIIEARFEAFEEPMEMLIPTILGTYEKNRCPGVLKFKVGVVELDFNRSYNPPCAFTPFATCPLPPKGNYLTAGILAGEKFTGH